MRVLVQRVKNARVTVEQRIVAAIRKGLLLFVGIGKDDSQDDIEYMCKKVVSLRVFEDQQCKMNLNVKQVEGQILSVSQFTLYADTGKGNRPGFDQSADPETAEKLWEDFNKLLKENGIVVQRGVFGARMDVDLINNGPVTIWLDSKNR